MNNKPRILMDERERGAIRTAFIQLDCDLEIITMDLGDYFIAPNVIIERKRGDDLVSSLFDTRFFTQLLKLKQNFQFPLLILEHSEKLFNRAFVQESSIYGALLYALYKIQIPIIFTLNETHTAKYIYHIAQSYQEQGFIPDKSLIISFEKNINEISYDDQLYFLEGFSGLGKKTAELLLQYFGTPLNIIHAINSTELIFNSSNKPTGLSGLLANVKGIGIELFKKLQMILKNPF